MAAIFFAFRLVKSLTAPIKHLADLADGVSHGDLSKRSDILRNDEIGQLSQAFNGMIDRLKDQIVHLEQRVADRTQELCTWVSQLESRNHEIATLKNMTDLFQACQTHDEIYQAVGRALSALFPNDQGNLSILNNSKTTLEKVNVWGVEDATSNSTFPPEGCWAIRRGKSHLVKNFAQDPVCNHIENRPQGGYSLCVQLIAQGETLGILHLSGMLKEAETDQGAGHDRVADIQRVAETVAEHTALALANLNLRETLRNQSIRDPLTGLFNRRYMEEALQMEFHRAQRQKSHLGIVMLDLDHFKTVNDTYGHDAGDAALREFSLFLRRHIRFEDIACRFGGEEFIVILPGAILNDCAARAESLRRAVEEKMDFSWQGNPIPLRLSAGVAAYPENASSAWEILEAADRALYQSKQNGRNRITIATTASKKFSEPDP